MRQVAHALVDFNAITMSNRLALHAEPPGDRKGLRVRVKLPDIEAVQRGLPRMHRKLVADLHAMVASVALDVSDWPQSFEMRLPAPLVAVDKVVPDCISSRRHPDRTLPEGTISEVQGFLLPAIGEGNDGKPMNIPKPTAPSLHIPS